MLLGTTRGPIYLYYGYLYIPPRDIPGNIVGIFSPEIWPPGGLHGLQGFSGVSIYTYTGRGAYPCPP